jgi:hypothetical protein
MKLNGAAEMLPVTWPEIGQIRSRPKGKQRDIVN